ncbi:nuclear transport factor 2 family protein [Pseudoalteromonas sp. JBTF-M23]|uniref:Nuclear transport factor 2 family protein n=1 Tax=Pseudoalteromonas caenipelagi TaxID=2726988 RepID=A0A849VH82_9GAMM|nr:nuclear transport factor 2 family protein [Pseudoalteromonas caenipelagi]NOU52170.1 nuclear transport factor 2 family protein [Pseudoalteromonas caenipelagi]
MKPQQTQSSDLAAIISLITKYFDGLHYGDTQLLASIFHQDAWLKAPNSRRKLNQWLVDVADRPVPATQGNAYEYAILSIEVVQDQAMVKVHCPLFSFNYVDFLGLLKEDGNWLIVNKMYTNVTL